GLPARSRAGARGRLGPDHAPPRRRAAERDAGTTEHLTRRLGSDPGRYGRGQTPTVWRSGFDFFLLLLRLVDQLLCDVRRNFLVTQEVHVVVAATARH